MPMKSRPGNQSQVMIDSDDWFVSITGNLIAWQLLQSKVCVCVCVCDCVFINTLPFTKTLVLLVHRSE